MLFDYLLYITHPETHYDLSNSIITFLNLIVLGLANQSGGCLGREVDSRLTRDGTAVYGIYGGEKFNPHFDVWAHCVCRWVSCLSVTNVN